MKKVWLLENEQARWFEFEEPHDMPNEVTVTMLTEKFTDIQKVEKYILMRMDMLKEELHKNPSEENTLVIMHSIGEMTMILQLLEKESK